MSLAAISLPSSNPMRPVLLAILLFEAIVYGLAVPVMIFVSDVPAEPAAWFGGGAAVLALIAAALMRRPVGYPVAWITQLAGIALGFLTSAMFIIGLMFAGLWLLTFVLGRRLAARSSTP